MMRMRDSRGVKAMVTTHRNPEGSSPMATYRCSASCALGLDSINGSSEKMAAASLKVTPCFYSFDSALVESHSNSMSQGVSDALKSQHRLSSELNRDWVFSDGNAGAVLQPNFFRRVEDLAKLDWEAIRTRYWSACRDAKQAEFLVADFFPWTGITKIGCHSATTATHVQEILKGASHRPEVLVKPEWYY